MKKALYSLFILLCFTAKTQTQVFTVEDGLSNKNITAILQARNGYLWIGTDNGLNLYDGYTFYEYNRHNGLSNGKINCLYEDKKGQLWIGTWEGLNILNQKTGSIKKVFQHKSAQVLNSEITAIEEAADGSVLVGIGEGDIIEFKDENTFKKVYTLPKHENIFKTGVDKIKVLPDSSILLINNFNTLKKITRNFKEDIAFKDLELVFGLSVKKETIIIVDLKGNVRKVSSKTGQLTDSIRIAKLNLPNDNLTQVFMPNDTGMFIGYSEGSLSYTNLKTGKLIDYSADTQPFINSAFTVIYPDRNGILWLGSDYGLMRFCPKEHHFENYLFLENSDYKSKNSIRGMIEDDKGDVYIGGYNGLFRLQPATGNIKQFVFDEYPKARLNAYYPYRLLDDGNFIWIVSEARGFYRFNKQTEKIEFPVPASGFYKGFSLLKDVNGLLWLGTHHGLYTYNAKQNKLAKYNNPNDLFDISGIEISELTCDPKGNIWIGSYSSGLFKMEKERGIVKHYSDVNTPTSLNFITALFFENDTTLWIGTRGSGLARLNTVTNKQKFYTKKNGLADNSVAGIIRDNSGTFWISTFNGLSKFNEQTATFENYYDKDGLTDNEFNTTAYLKTRNGKLYFGGLNGINAFYPQALTNKQTHHPEIFLTYFSKYDGSTDSLKEMRLDLHGLKEVSFTHKDKFFSFSFTLDDYYDPLRNTFFYKLEGLENTWTNIGTQHNIRFNSLPPGDYNLKIKGVNSEGNASANEITVHISVSRAFYTTWWFYLLVLISMMALVYTITRYRIYQSLKIQKLRTKISSDLHDEVGSLLTRISIQAELIKQGISQNDTIAEVGRIADTSRQATAAMSDVLWSIDARNDKMGNLVDRLREQAGEILFPLEVEVNFTIRHIDLSKDIDNIIRQNLFLVFKEAINNIAKHARATKVEILLENRANQFVMVIEDNGITQSKTNTPVKRGQGLRNMKMRAELLEGTLETDTGNGYRITLKIKKFT